MFFCGAKTEPQLLKFVFGVGVIFCDGIFNKVLTICDKLLFHSAYILLIYSIKIFSSASVIVACSLLSYIVKK